MPDSSTVIGGEQVPIGDVRDQQLLPDVDQGRIAEVILFGDHGIETAIAIFALGDPEQGVP
ncbi:hypothetical protein [Mycolicibacterium peregrinum]|uniref:hypothetical protein n=1 Tax=Mycolicibacterium peregrinum TaxID=43304 RepID=UPI0039B78ACC